MDRSSIILEEVFRKIGRLFQISNDVVDLIYMKSTDRIRKDEKYPLRLSFLVPSLVEAEIVKPDELFELVSGERLHEISDLANLNLRSAGEILDEQLDNTMSDQAFENCSPEAEGQLRTGMMEGSKYDSGLYWAIAVAVSSVLAILTAPFFGRFADKFGKFRVFCFSVGFTGIVASLSLLISGSNFWYLLILFVFFNWIFEISQSIYDSYLVDLSDSKEETTKISSFAWGFGYLGGALFAVIYLIMDRLEISESSMIPIFGVFFLISSVPALWYFYKVVPSPIGGRTFKFRDLIEVRTPVPWKDLFVYWVVADVVAAVLYFAPLYLKSDLGLSITMIGGVMLVGQLIAFPATIYVGRLANQFGRLSMIRMGLLVWAVGLLGFYFAESLAHVAIVFLLLSLVVGSTQALLRAHFADRVEQIKSAEGLGFFAIAQKSASVIAPAFVIVSSWFTGSIAPAFIALAVLVCIAFLLTLQLKE